MKKLLSVLFVGGLGVAAPAADKVAEIVFDREPKEIGLTFLREHCQPEEVDVGGKKVWAWKFWAGSYPKMLWVHDARFVFTDPAFKNGRMPVVKGEIEYLHTSDTSFEAFLDTADGVKNCGGKWGSSKEFRTMTFKTDKAVFKTGGTVEKGGAFDIQAKACNSAIYIRRIKVVGVDQIESPDFSQLLRVEDVASPGRDLFVFRAGDEAKTVYTLANLARVAFTGEARFTLETHDGKVLKEEKKAVTIPATGKGTIAFTAPTAGLKKSVYFTRLALTGKGETEPCLVREGSFALASPAKLRGAEKGEFLYGLDACFGFQGDHPELLKWAKFMGVNVMRYGIDSRNEDKYAADILDLRKNGIEVVAITDGAKVADHDTFVREQEEIEKFLKRFARRVHPPFWELGNEPDLPFFFRAGIPRYMEGYYRMYDAIKSVDPKAMVSNGGIANAPHVKESPLNTRDFFELLDPTRIDYVAYHAHGRGYAAEHSALSRMKENAQRAGKRGLKYADTETGVMSPGRDADLLQASTCVQKFVCAQENGLPYMLWFRLYFKGDEEAYGNLVSYREPKPVVLAYRSLVERLRDFAFDRRLDTGADGVKAFLFAERKNGARRVAVCWRDGSGTLDLARLKLPASAKGYDIFGNELDDLAAAAESLAFTPIYVAWEGNPL